jgi:hypothetical protein
MIYLTIYTSIIRHKAVNTFIHLLEMGFELTGGSHNRCLALLQYLPKQQHTS